MGRPGITELLVLVAVLVLLAGAVRYAGVGRRLHRRFAALGRRRSTGSDSRLY